ncbi:MAG: hypothetical protein MI919_29375 [Holophagales bacterium]|nr:hypothetical protein [Holophagales bacterium]
MGDDRPGLVCCPDQPYVLCSQSSCKLLAGVAICDCIYMGRGVSLATPYSSFYDLNQPAGKKSPAPWTDEVPSDVCQYMEELHGVDKALSTYNPRNYNYAIAGSYICEDAENMIWAQCDGAICEVLDGEGKPLPADQWQKHDKSTCTCQAVRSPGLMVGPVEEGLGRTYEAEHWFAETYCGSLPKLSTIDYPENRVHIGVAATPELLETPLYQYLFGFYEGRIFRVTQTECPVIEPARPR